MLRPTGLCLPGRLLARNVLSSVQSSWPCRCYLISITRSASDEGKWSSERTAANGSFGQHKQESEISLGKISLLMSKLEMYQHNTVRLLKMRWTDKVAMLYGKTLF